MIDVLRLLADGAWTLARSEQLHEHARRLGLETRHLLLTYRSHRLSMMSGGSEANVDGIETLRYLLRSAPGEPLCDGCLAFACAVSLTEMRALTAALRDAEPQHFRQAPTCASCRRTVASIVAK